MAGAGYKLFNTGDVLTAAQVNTYLQEQTVMVFANSTARTTALSGVLAEGMVSYLQDTNAVEVYNGSAWVGVSGAGDVTEVQAGTGISVASGTGPIPVVTNTMATAVDAKGDLIVGTGADTFARLAVGTNGYTLVADSVEATGLKWAAPASPTISSNWTLISSGSVTTGTSASFAVSGYDRYILHFNMYSTGTPTVKFRFNALSSSNYRYGASMSGGGMTTQTDVDGINLDNFSTFNDQPMGFLEINNANTGTKPQFFGSWKRANNPADNTRAYLLNYSGLYNANITLSSIDVVSTVTIGEFAYRIWGL